MEINAEIDRQDPGEYRLDPSDGLMHVRLDGAATELIYSLIPESMERGSIDEFADNLDATFAEQKEQGIFRAEAHLLEWAEKDIKQGQLAVVVDALPGVRDMTDEERAWVGVAEVVYLAHVLGVPWKRPYENENHAIQHVHPDLYHLEDEASIGAAPLWPHNEILPVDGQVVCSKFSALFAVHNENSGTSTTIYDAQRAIAELSESRPDLVEVLKGDNFVYAGTVLEQEAGAAADDNPIVVSMLYPFMDEDGNEFYELIADLDDKTMKPIEGNELALEALHELREVMMRHEVEYTIPDGSTLIWYNRGALHGRRPVTDMARELERVQIGEPEYSGR